VTENDIGPKRPVSQVCDTVHPCRTEPIELPHRILHARNKRLVRRAVLPATKNCCIKHFGSISHYAQFLGNTDFSMTTSATIGINIEDNQQNDTYIWTDHAMVQ